MDIDITNQQLFIIHHIILILLGVDITIIAQQLLKILPSDQQLTLVLLTILISSLLIIPYTLKSISVRQIGKGKNKI